MKTNPDSSRGPVAWDLLSLSQTDKSRPMDHNIYLEGNRSILTSLPSGRQSARVHVADVKCLPGRVARQCARAREHLIH